MPASLNQAWIALGVATVTTGIVFALEPGIDLWVSGLFFDGTGFPLNSNPFINKIRHLLWDFCLVVAFACLIGLLIWLWMGPMARVPVRLWLFSVIYFVIGPGLISDYMLKGHWGRARPAHIEAFGGTMQFTPFWLPTDQCIRNCSFVAGEPAGMTAVAIVTALFLWPVTRGFWRTAAMAMLAGSVALSCALRIMAGRHFLSDALFSILIMSATALVLWRVMQMRQPWRSISRLAWRADRKQLAQYLMRRT